MAKLYGVQCKTRLTASLVASGRGPGGISIGNAGFFDRIARTRPGLPWPILRRSVAVDHEVEGIRRHQPLADVPAGRSGRLRLFHAEALPDSGSIPPGAYESTAGVTILAGATGGGGGAVPLPGAAALAACGLLAAGRRRRR
jgi:MprA protease rhombosortase-interaction domain-containing protein